MMTRLMALLAFVAIISLVRVEANHIQGTLSDAGVQIQLTKHKYFQNLGRTCYFYKVTAPVSSTVIQFTLSANGCGSTDIDDRVIPKTENFGGFRWVNEDGFFTNKHGQKKNTEETYVLCLKGDKLGREDGAVTFEVGQYTATGTIAVPSCTADSQFPDVQGSTSTLDCNDTQAIADAMTPDTKKVEGNDCLNNYTLETVVTAQNGLYMSQDMVIVTVKDNYQPDIHTSAATNSFTASCTTEIATLDASSVNATDNCAGDVSIEFCEERVPGTCLQQEFRVRTWTATDECGNSRCHTQTIAVIDDNSPQFDEIPGFIVDECNATNQNETFYPIANVTATDACDNITDLVKEPVRVRMEGKCSNTYSLKTTWEAEDDCGNKNFTTQYITIKDDTPPDLNPAEPLDETWVNVSDPATQCALPAAIVVTAVDDCDTDDWNVTENDDDRTDFNDIPESCVYKHTTIRKWETADECGNPASEVQTFHVDDDVEPTLDYNSTTVDVNCDETDDYPWQDVTPDDNCPGTPSVTNGSNPLGDDCETLGDIERYWTVTDDCGNTDTFYRTLHVVDPYGPNISLTNVYDEGQVFNCSDPPEWVDTVKAYDTGCSSTELMVYGENLTERINSTVCEGQYKLVFTWIAFDCAGNNDTVVRTVNVVDTTIPTITPDDADPSVDTCTPTTPSATANDTCSPDFAAANLTGPTNNSYPNTGVATCTSNKTWVWTWQVYDECGNPNSFVQTTYTEDVTAPNITEPESTTLDCDANLTTNAPAASDNCDGSVPATDTDVYLDPEDQVVADPADLECKNYTILRTWTATDDCMNSHSVVETITVHDQHGATLDSKPANLTGDSAVKCDAIPKPEDVCASDNCGSVTLKLNVTDLTPVCGKTYTQLRTWTALDGCGQGESHTQFVEIIDMDDPEWEDLSMAQNATRECNETLPMRPDLTANDTCNTVTETPHPEVRENGTCIKVYDLIWNTTATDGCQTIEHIQRVSVQKSYPPVLSLPDGRNDTCECDELASCLKWPTASDYCFGDSAGAIDPDWCNGEELGADGCQFYTETVIDDDGDNCANTYILNRKWFITDDCDLTGYLEENITVVDSKKPQWTSPLPDNYSQPCDDIKQLPKLSWNDTCAPTSGQADPVLESTTEGSTECANDYVEVYNWSYTDCAGNMLTHRITVTTYDNSTPTVDDPQDDGAQCTATAPPSVCAQDNCAPIYVNYSETKENQTCGFKLYREWVAFDDCGNQATGDQTFTVKDTLDPEWKSDSNYPADFAGFTGSVYTLDGTEAAERCGDTDLHDPSAEDNCDGVVTPSCTSLADMQVNDTDSCQDYYKRQNCSVKDVCDNTIWVEIRQLVQDTTKPVIQDPNDQLTGQFCNQNVPDPYWQVTDCDLNATNATRTLTENNTDCKYRFNYTYTFSYTDDCGNVAENKTAKVISTYNESQTTVTADPDEEFKACKDDPPAPNATGSTACGEITPERSGPVRVNATYPECKYNYNLTWNFSFDDTCGGTDWDTTTYIFTDEEAPDAEQASDPLFDLVVENYCPGDEKRGDETNRTAPDDCSGNVTAAPVITNTTAPFCAYIFNETFTYTFKDECGNEAEPVTVQVDYKHSTRPTINLNGVDFDNNDVEPQFADAVTISCNEEYDLPEYNATDACGVSLTVTPNVTTLETGTCQTKYRYCYAATDTCQLTKTVCFDLTIVDDIIPVIHDMPSDMVVECGFLPAIDEVTATHPCSNVNLSLVESRRDGAHCCDYTIKREWTAKTACKVSAPLEQTIVVEDNFPPQFVNVCPDTEVDCVDDIPPCENVTARHALKVGWCGENITTVDFCTGDDTTDRWIMSTSSNDEYEGGETIVVRSAEGTLDFYGNFTATGAPEIKLALSFNQQKNRSESVTFASSLPNDLVANCYGDASSSDPMLVVKGEWAFYDNLESFTATRAEETCTVAFASSTGFSSTAAFGSGANGRNSLTGFRVDLTLTCGSGSSQEIVSVEIRAEVNSNPSSANQECSALVNQVCEECCGYDDDCNATVVKQYNHTADVKCEGIYEDSQIWKVFTRVFVAEDSAGNEVRASQNVFFVDNTKPQLFLNGTAYDNVTYSGEILTIQCNESRPDYIPTVNDTCTSANVTHVPPTLNESCGSTGHYVYNFDWEDECGNSDSAKFTILVEDTAPYSGTIDDNDVFNKTYNCTEAPTTDDYPAATFTDNCDENKTTNFTSSGEENVPVPDYDQCVDSYKVHVYYKVQDDCGEWSNEPKGTYTIVDEVPPAFSDDDSLDDETQNCTLPDWQTYTTAADNHELPGGSQATCRSANVNYDNHSNPLYTAACDPVAKIIAQEERVWVATDLCGNEATQMYTATAVDEVAPVIDGPDNITVNCSSIPTPDDWSIQVTVTDNCDDAVNITNDPAFLSGPFYPDQDTQTCNNEYRIQYKWNWQDSCANAADEFVWTITVVDRIKPTLEPTSLPNVTYNCTEVEKPPSVCASDNCHGVNITLTETEIEPVCTHTFTIKREWVAQDDCGLLSDPLIQYVKVQDIEKPYFTDGVGPVTDLNEYCIDATNQTDYQVNDTCDEALNGVNADPYETAPVYDNFTACPYNYTFLRIWNKTDACGNLLSQNITVTRYDDQPPTIDLPVGFEENPSALCTGRKNLSGVPDIPNVTASDDCSSDPSDLTATEPEDSAPVVVNGSCYGNYTVIRHWSFVDECGMESTQDQTVHMYDDVKPMFNFTPEDTTVNCSDVVPLVNATAYDECIGHIDVDYMGESVIDDSGDNCGNTEVRLRRWNASDDCGNWDTYDQTITVVDQAPPMLEEPLPDSVVQANCSGPTPEDVCVSDNCRNVTLWFSQTRMNVSRTKECFKYDFDLNRTWKAMDECGQVDIFHQLVEVRDSGGPEWGPEVFNMTKSLDCSEAKVADILSADDVCSGQLDVIVSNNTDFPTEGCANETFVFTYTATDECDNEISRDQTLDVTDTTGPNVTFSFDLSDPEYGEHACHEDPAPLPNLTLTDDCSGVVDDYADPTPERFNSTECDGNYTVVWTWTVYDDCGNPTVVKDNMTYTDTDKPFFTYFPANRTIYGCDVPQKDTNHTYDDLCYPAGELNLTFINTTRINSTGENACDSTYELVHLWRLCDKCDNCIYRSQHFFVIDNEAPQVDDKPDELIPKECNDSFVPPAVCAEDCSTNFTMNFTEVRTNGSCLYQYNLTRTWTVEDQCGNPDSFQQIVQVNDTNKPTFSYTGDLMVNATCAEFEEDDNIKILTNVNGHDSCSDDTKVRVNFTNRTEGELLDCKYEFTHIRTWTATDECDNEEMLEQSLDVYDDTEPVTVEPSVDCLSPVKALQTVEDITALNNIINASDDCSEDNELTLTVINCTSLQTDLNEDHPDQPGFMTHCYMDGDDLKVLTTVDLDKPEGRLFIVTVEVKDLCGNKAYETKKYLVPINAQSWGKWDTVFDGNYSEVNDNPDFTCTAGGGPPNCEETCPCEYHSPVCSAATLTESTPTLALDASTKEYTFTAPLNSAVSAADRTVAVVLGVDLSVVSLVSSDPEARLGSPRDGFVSGLYWEGNFSGTKEFKFKLAKKTADSVGWNMLAWQIIDNQGDLQDAKDGNAAFNSSRANTIANDCETGAVTFDTAGIEARDSSIEGNVGIYGFLMSNQETTALFGVSGAVVQLFRDGAEVASVVTDHDGDFHFPVMNCTADGYTLRIDNDGVFQDDLKLHEYIFPAEFAAGHPFGFPVSAECSGNNLQLFISKSRVLDADPSYIRGPRLDRTDPDFVALDFTSFVGIGHSAAFWATQFARLGDSKNQLRIDTERMETARKLSFDYLSGCGFTDENSMTTALSGSDDKAKLVAGALNHFAGQGILAAFRTVQENVILPYAKARICSGVDMYATDFLDKILDAY